MIYMKSISDPSICYSSILSNHSFCSIHRFWLDLYPCADNFGSLSISGLNYSRFQRPSLLYALKLWTFLTQVVCWRRQAYLLRLLQQCLLQEVHSAQPGQEGAISHHRWELKVALLCLQVGAPTGSGLQMPPHHGKTRTCATQATENR